ncbi:MAG: NAD+ synthase [Paracoccaceae bacterium]|uniref:NAD+ synthase n=1 Tax=Candidatus Salinivivens marinus TaxID=3381703 RepID=UPI000B6CD8CD|nr:NAD+ synthase [Marinovum sp.]OUU14633.1 MAG: NAD+ synthase [Rhodobacteraceae bacterium TMED38]PDH61070.1 MAG: NAD+ synthase [Rhodobacteraceae bacterium MED-G08]|tara:strand:- start:3451 stop:5106 length:1656 start_codon:yes stop_codon:yes gene_type:complete
MANKFQITLAQLNPTVGDLEGNYKVAIEAWDQAQKMGSDLIAFTELFITGYNTQDLIKKPSFFKAAQDQILKLAKTCKNGPAIAIGGPAYLKGKLYNAYYILADGNVANIIMKHHLPNQNVFDEKRIFDEGEISGPYQIGPIRIGSPICEDAWHSDVSETLSETGAQLLLVPNGSPYYNGKNDVRLNKMVARVVETNLPLIYLNMVGAQDDQVFDGGTFALNRGGRLAIKLPLFEEALEHIVLEESDMGWNIIKGELAKVPCDKELDYHAMVMGLRDYCKKSGFEKVVLGLSGGIDSALVAVIASDAIGSANVRSIMLPSPYTSQTSLIDATDLVDNLGCKSDTLPINDSLTAIDKTLSSTFEGRKIDLTEENIQSRLRGLLLMAVSNKFGEMLLTTGNKSEVSVGYSTIYGDMAGGFNPIKDLYKTKVFEISKWRNKNHRPWMKGPPGSLIPDSIITKAPTAELRPNQKDSDSLPDYPVLDAILTILVDEDGSTSDCLKAGYNKSDVSKVEKLLYDSEHKRFQSAPGTRLSQRAFWLDRRYPIVNKWRDK